MIRVAIVEDNLAYLKAMQLLISSQPDMQLVYSKGDLYDINLIVAEEPDIVILDIDLPGFSGIEGVGMLKQQVPDINIIMLTVFEDEDKIFNSIKAGAQGYLLKKDPPEKISDAIRCVFNGESIMNGKIARKILEYFTRQESSLRKKLEQYKLTKREEEILQLLIEGKSYKQIAEQCFISMNTLFSHSRNLFNKLNIHSRAEIAAKFH